MDILLQKALSGSAHLLFDGGMGTMLQAAGLAAGELPELLCLTNPQEITEIHRSYVNAGSQVVTTNTFGANRHKLGDRATVEEVFAAAVACARQSGAQLVAADIGPIGALLRPMGTMSFDEAYGLFAQQARAAQAAGADLFIIETMTDLAEIKAAVLACREQTDLPVIATMTFEADGRTFLGTSPEVAAVTLDALGVDALGINCSQGPSELRPLAQRMLKATAKPIIVQANAGLPHVENGRTVFDIDPDAYAQAAAGMIDDGVGILGGCCGTDPRYIERMTGLLRGHTPAKRTIPEALTVTSAQRLVELPVGGNRIAVIGERINPTGKKRLKEALRSGDYDYVVSQGISQQEQGADILDVNVGLPDIDEVAAIQMAGERLVAAVTLPLQFDSTVPEALEAAVRRYPGKPIINSVNGKREVMDQVFPIAARYGANLIGLTLDEDGIPTTAEKRFEIARRIVEEAARYGIPASRIIIDCLAMTASTDQAQATETLRAIKMVKRELGVSCTLGVSNISFGLPQRPLLNSTYLAAAFGAGLDVPILNPGSERYMDVVRSYRVLNGEDAGSEAYIERYGSWSDPYKSASAGNIANGLSPSTMDGTDTGTQAAGIATSAIDQPGTVEHCILTGRKAEVAEATHALLERVDGMDLINERFIPALDEVGVRFDRGSLFLPQLMAAAEAARAGFDVIKASMPASVSLDKGAICVATVKGDIHDIGKNIVKMLLDNYGYNVIDLGRDVDPQAVLDAVRAHSTKLVGLSALMTTTVANMAETIDLLHREAPGTLVMVGGAVLTPEYAEQIGADFYAKDAAESARIAAEVFG